MRTLVASLLLLQTLSPVAGAAVLSAPFISGSTVYSVRDLSPLFASRVGTPVSRALLQDISSAIRDRYKADGYLVPVVVFDESQLASAYPRLYILETRLTEVAVRGNTGPHAEIIESLATQLQTSALTEQGAREILEKIDSLPGLDLHARFERRNAQANDHSLVLNVNYEPVTAGVYAHNRGVEALGQQIIGGHLTEHGLLGAQESITLSAQTSNEYDRYRYGSARIARQSALGYTSVRYSSSEAEPEDSVRYSVERWQVSNEFRGTSFGAWQVRPRLSFNMRDSTGLEDGRRYLGVRTRDVELGARALHRAERGYTRTGMRYVLGLDALGASAYTDANVPITLDYRVVLLDVTHVRSLGSGWQVRIDAEGQWSNDDLPAGERFTFGGALLGRAYDPAALIGDRGAAGSVEVGRATRSVSWLDSTRLFGQFDYGAAWNRDTDGHEDAASITAGLDARIRSLLASLQVSHALMQPAALDTSDTRMFFQLQMQF